MRVGGRTTFADTEPGTWFNARLMMPTATPETTPPGGASKRVVLSPSLILDTEDDEGSPVEVFFSDMLEVESEDLGNDMWQVSSEPRPFRKKHGIIGYECELRRIEAHDFEPRAA